jgi:hypothetical protein
MRNCNVLAKQLPTQEARDKEEAKKLALALGEMSNAGDVAAAAMGELRDASIKVHETMVEARKDAENRVKEEENSLEEANREVQEG